MPVSDKDREDILKEVFNQQRVNLLCGLHGYMGPIKDHPEMMPAVGCANCWRIFYIHEIATTPPSERSAKLAEIEEVLAKAVELAEAGKWDFFPTRHPKIEIGQE